MPKKVRLPITLVLVIIVTFLTLLANGSLIDKPQKFGKGTAVNQAKHLYSLRKNEGMDFSKGPCLSDALMPGWVVDIAHSPRQSVDDLAENQCPAYREGNAKHFVELDVNGELIRVK